MMPKQHTPVGRGGYRVNAGRKSSWRHSETQTIRVPKIFVQQLMQLARQFDHGEFIDSEAPSTLAWTEHVTEPQMSVFDSVSNSKMLLSDALTQAQKILRSKRSTPESLARQKQASELEVHISFEVSRLSADCLAAAYEQIVPIVCRSTVDISPHNKTKSAPIIPEAGGMSG